MVCGRTEDEELCRSAYALVCLIEGAKHFGNASRGQEEIWDSSRRNQGGDRHAQVQRELHVWVKAHAFNWIKIPRRSLFKRKACTDRQIRKSMARIKFVLQERRLGLMAAIAPETEGTKPPPSWTDPARSFEAMRARDLQYSDIRVPKMLRNLDVQAGAAVVGDEQVNVEEVESRDEGFGGGREAEEFVNETEVDADGRVKQAH